MPASDEIWVLGAAGRIGRAVAERLHESGPPLVLAGRDDARLRAVSDELGGSPRRLVGPLDAALAQLGPVAPAVVVNTIGPFAATAAKVARACPPGTHYVDMANELAAIQAILALDAEAAATGRALVTGAGFGVLATESVVLRLCEGEPAPGRVRVDAVASVATQPGTIGAALAGSIVDGVAGGGREVHDGRLVRARLAGEPVRLTTPDGDVVTSASTPSGELIAAWRASGAGEVVAGSALAPTAVVAWLLPALVPLLRARRIRTFVTGRLARAPTRARARPRANSWAHARAEWPSGTVREGWLRTGDGMAFTAAATAEVARRLAAGEGRPGAHTPGALFGATLALAAGGEFRLDQRRIAPAGW